MPAALATERLRLRRWRGDDADRYRALWLERDPRSRRIVTADGRPTVEELRARLHDQLSQTTRTGLALLVVHRRTDGEFLGYCGLTPALTGTEEPEIAYELLRAAHGHGYATEAARVVMGAARASGRRRLWASVPRWNTPSAGVLTKLGFGISGAVDPDPDHRDLVWWTRAL